MTKQIVIVIAFAALTLCLNSGAYASTIVSVYSAPDRTPRVSVGVMNGRYSIPNVPEGSYEVRGMMSNPMTRMTSRGPAGLKVIADGDQAVTCQQGQPIQVNFRIGSSGG